MKVADLNENPMHEYVHSQDPAMLHPMPVRPKTLLLLSVACILFIAVVAALAVWLT